MIKLDGAVNTISWNPSAGFSLFAIGISNVMVPAAAVNVYVSSDTTTLPNFKTARSETPLATPAVRYVNVSGTFLAHVAITIGKYSTVKYSGTIADVMTVVSIVIATVELVVAFVDAPVVVGPLAGMVELIVDLLAVLNDVVVGCTVVREVEVVTSAIDVVDDSDVVDDPVVIVLAVFVCQHVSVLPFVLL